MNFQLVFSYDINLDINCGYKSIYIPYIYKSSLFLFQIYLARDSKSNCLGKTNYFSYFLFIQENYQNKNAFSFINI